MLENRNISVYLLPVHLDLDGLCSASNASCYAYLGVFSPLIFLCLLSGTCMFPVYLQNLQQNDIKNRVLPEYPLIVHFSQVIFWTESLFVGAFLELILLHYSDWYYSMLFVSHFVMELIYSLWLTVAMAEQVFICALVVQRVIGAKFSNSKKKSQKYSTNVLSVIRYCAYIPMLIANLAVGVFKFGVLKYHDDTFNGNVMLERIEGFQMGAYLFISVCLVIISGIVISGNLKSEKYFRYQIFMLVLVKIFYIPSISILSFAFNMFNLSTIFGGVMLIDMFMMHFLLQFGYLNHLNGYLKKDKEGVATVNVQMVMSSARDLT